MTIQPVLEEALAKVNHLADTPPPDTARRASPEELRAAVATLPADWGADLCQATVMLKVDRMLALIENVQTQAPELAETLAQWVHDFEYEKLLNLVAPQTAPQT